MRYFFFFALMAAALVACGGGETGDPITSESSSNSITSESSADLHWASDNDRETFERERQLWREQGIQNYSFRQRFGSPGIYSDLYTVYVKNGNAVYAWGNGIYAPDRLYYPDSYSNAFFAGLFTAIISISDIYTEIERYAHDSATRLIQVQYLSTWHYPTYVYIGLNDGNFRSVTIDRWNLVIDPEYPE